MTDIPDDLRMAIWTVCVTDLEESKRFYCEGLGFKEGKSHASDMPPNSDIAKAFDVPKGAKTRGTFLSRPDVHMRLVCFDEPKPVGGRGRKPTNQVGPRCMIFLTSNPRAVGERLEKLGGKIVHERRGEPFDAVFVTDPDGFSIQIENLPYSQFEQGFQK